MLTELMQERFHVRRTHCNMRNPHHYAIPSINFVCHGSNSVPNLGPRIWNLVPYRLKVLNSISFFKNEIKKMQPEICLCKLFKIYYMYLVLVFCNLLQVTLPDVCFCLPL